MVQRRDTGAQRARRPEDFPSEQCRYQDTKSLVVRENLNSGEETGETHRERRVEAFSIKQCQYQAGHAQNTYTPIPFFRAVTLYSVLNRESDRGTVRVEGFAGFCVVLRNPFAGFPCFLGVPS